MSNMTLDTTPEEVPKRKLLLIVEDDKPYRQMFTELFGKEGYEVEIATNGSMAVEIANRKVPALILLDILMPVMDGFEMLKEFKSSEKFKDVPIIVLSNLSADSEIKKAKELGATEYIVKSNISVKEVVEIVKKYLAQA